MFSKEIYNNSEQIDDLLSKIPNWITRWGISLIALILFSVILVSNFITYPEIVKGRIIIQSNNLNITSCIFQIPNEQIYRVKSGNEVILKFERYPFQKFGVVKCRIANISDSLSNGNYIYKINLPQQLKNAQNIQIVFNNGMLADCEIIVGKKSIFKRLFNYIINDHD
jgi:hypothetical protein